LSRRFLKRTASLTRGSMGHIPIWVFDMIPIGVYCSARPIAFTILILRKEIVFHVQVSSFVLCVGFCRNPRWL
jgi:hypothetical protein